MYGESKSQNLVVACSLAMHEPVKQKNIAVIIILESVPVVLGK